MHSGREERRRFITVSHRVRPRERFILHLYLLTLQNNLFYPLFLERHLLNISVTSQRNVAFSPRVEDSKLIAIFFPRVTVVGARTYVINICLVLRIASELF